MEHMITFICSVVIATLISLATFLFEIQKHKQNLITHTLTTNRLQWIADVRALLNEFLCAYIDQKPEKELRKLKAHIELFLVDKPTYQELTPCMENCCSHSYTEESYKKLIIASQNVLQEVWIRIKIEGGQNKATDEKIQKMVEDYKKENK